MAATASEGELGLLHAAVARHLAERIASGEATASDVTNAIKLLKDNNITCDPDTGSELDRLQKQLENGAPLKADNTDLHAALEQLDFSNTQAN